MRKIAVCAAFAACLVGCSTDEPSSSIPGGADTPVTTVAATTSISPEMITVLLDTSFLRTLDSSGLTYLNAKTVVAQAHALCDAFDKGGLLIDDALRAIASAMSYTLIQAGQFAGASVAAYCPQHKALFN